MSVLINEKLHSHRLKWRWPLSRQVTLSIGTLAVLLTVWWTVAALQLISPLFLPPPQQVLAKLLTIAGPQGFMDATLWQHLAASIFFGRSTNSSTKREAAEPFNGLPSRYRVGSSAFENAPSAVYAPLRHSRREETPHE